MRKQSKLLFCSMVFVSLGLTLAVVAAQQDQVAALKQSIAANQQRLHQYQWVETTIVSVKGDEKSKTLKACRYGPDGKVQKQQISAPAQQSSGRGLKGRIVAHKKEEMTEYMQQAAALIHEYVPPDSHRIQAAKDAGNVTFKPGSGGVQVQINNYLKPGDSLALNLSNAGIQKIHAGTYLDSQKDAITLDTSFATLSDGTSYPAQSTLVAPAKNIQVVIQNSNYQKIMAAPPAQQPQSPSSSGIDHLTAPIALYPDALIAQILTASTNPVEVNEFSKWLSQNTSLQGSALQDAAHNAGFDTAFVALAPFPQVVQMMVHDPNWTKQLGEAFTSNKNAVFESIQRLRAQAQAAGNLQTNQQQQVQTQTTSSGQQVIVIQPSNPQVVYVPTYNTQTVYVQSTSTYPAVAYTTGVIIGAAAANNYYYGPYAWHGAALYNEAWDNRYDYAHARNEMYQQNANYRQGQYDQNAAQRQSALQSNQTQRQSTSSSNQAQRQSTATGMQGSAQANQTTRQSSAQTNQASRQSSFNTAQTNAQANQSARQASASTSSFGSGSGAQRSGMSSGGFSGFGGGGQARAESGRGSQSLGGGGRFGGGGGGRGRRR